MKSIHCVGVRHDLVDDQLPVGPTGRERLSDFNPACRTVPCLARNQLVGDRAVVRDEEGKMIRRASPPAGMVGGPPLVVTAGDRDDAIP